MNDLRNLAKKLEDLSRKATELDGTHNITLSELLSDEFISRCSSHTSLEGLLQSSPFKIDSIEDFKAIPDSEWDAYISGNTSYATWKEMQEAAAMAWTQKKLGF